MCRVECSVVQCRGAGAAAAGVRQGRAKDRSNLRVTTDHSRRPICLYSIIESNGVGDSTRTNKIFHIIAVIVNLVATITMS